MKSLLLLLFLSLNLIPAQAADKLNIIDAWVPEAPPGASVMAGFMKIHNPGKQDIDITAVTSDASKTVEMHLSKDIDGVARMLPQQTLRITAGSTLELKSGSYHLMLMNPLKRLKDGDTVNFSLTLSSGETQNFTARVKRQTAMGGGMRCGAGKCGGGKCGGN